MVEESTPKSLISKELQMSSATNYSIAGKKTQDLNLLQKLGLTLVAIATFIILITWAGVHIDMSALLLTLVIVGFGGGAVLYTYGTYKDSPAGIKNNGVWFNSLSNKGALGWITAILLTLFYICLYWYEDWFGKATGVDGSNEGLIAIFDPLSEIFRGKKADQWFLYGTLYSIAILFLGFKFIVKYRHNRYHLVRTIVVIFSQLVFAYFLPFILEALNATEAGYYQLNVVQSYPLDYGAFTGGSIKNHIATENQPFGMAFLVWSIIIFAVVTPFVTYLVGKRWYCSWFCGCGGLAETAGDSFRHLSNKSVKAWKIERWVIHSVLLFVLLMTVAVMYSYFTSSKYALSLPAEYGVYIVGGFLLLGIAMFLVLYLNTKEKSRNMLMVGLVLTAVMLIALFASNAFGNKEVFYISSKGIKKVYGFLIGAVFSGIIGVGFYPILGNRVWCRFGCPMAGYMGLVQRFKSRFRITTNGGQCISCGNCSTYCEQGIDVRAYAQKGQNIVRASCVGCGVCSSVCPRGVLKLENGPEEGRIDDNPIMLGNDGVKLNPSIMPPINKTGK